MAEFVILGQRNQTAGIFRQRQKLADLGGGIVLDQAGLVAGKTVRTKMLSWPPAPARIDPGADQGVTLEVR